MAPQRRDRFRITNDRRRDLGFKMATAVTVAALVLANTGGELEEPSTDVLGVQIERPEPVAVGASVPAPSQADTDGDRVADEFEADLLAASPADTFDVIIRSTSDAAAAQGVAGAFEVRRSLESIGGYAATMTAAQALALAAAPDTVRVDRDAIVTLSNDGGRSDFGADRARTELGVTGAGVSICVIDSGADPLHEQLDDGKIVGWVDFINQLPAPYDDHNNGVGGHGTHVASIAAGDGVGGPLAAAYRGVAPGANLYVAKAFAGTVPDDIPVISPGTSQESITVAAIEWCVAQPEVDIISMSFTKVGPTDGSDPLGQAVDAAVAAGKIAVAAAGNDGPNTTTGGVGFLGSPGAAASAITVGATADWSLALTAPNRSEGPFLPPFTSRGPTLDGRIKPDVVAPGHSVRAASSGTVAGYIDKDGTSMATPFVSGALALALERNPALGHADLAALVQDTAIDRGPAGKDPDWGAGMIDVHALVATAGGAAAVEPIAFPTHSVLQGGVGVGTPWVHTFSLGAGDLAVPIAATLIADGGPDLTGVFWDPDLQVELTDPLGVSLDQSNCPFVVATDCLGNQPNSGRQELVHAMPTVAGTYTLTVSAAGASGGTFLVDLSHGPVVSTLPEPCTVGWSGAGDGSSWLDGANWTSGAAPSPHDVVCIGQSGAVVHDLAVSSVQGIIVDGVLTVTGGSTLHITDTAGPAVVTGQLVVGGGSTATSAAELDLRGVMHGTGVFVGDVVNRGDLMPGGPAVGPFVVSGTYRQELSGVLSVDVNGLDAVSHDVLTVGGDAVLGGGLSIHTGFGASLGDEVLIVDVTGARTGAWVDVLGTNLGAGLLWQVDLLSYAPDAYLVVVSAPPPDDGEVTICHKVGTPAEKTMQLPRDAADAHMRAHGDTEGACA